MIEFTLDLEVIIYVIAPLMGFAAVCIACGYLMQRQKLHKTTAHYETK